jgi:hypothetical protein
MPGYGPSGNASPRGHGVCVCMCVCVCVCLSVCLSHPAGGAVCWCAVGGAAKRARLWAVPLQAHPCHLEAVQDAAGRQEPRRCAMHALGPCTACATWATPDRERAGVGPRPHACTFACSVDHVGHDNWSVQPCALAERKHQIPGHGDDRLGRTQHRLGHVHHPRLAVRYTLTHTYNGSSIQTQTNAHPHPPTHTHTHTHTHRVS